MINVDHGILPACTKEVKRDLHLDNANLGLLGSLVYVGLVLGKKTLNLIIARILGSHACIQLLQYKVRVDSLLIPELFRLTTLYFY